MDLPSVVNLLLGLSTVWACNLQIYTSSVIFNYAYKDSLRGHLGDNSESIDKSLCLSTWASFENQNCRCADAVRETLI